MSKVIPIDEYKNLSLEEKAKRWEEEAEKLGPCFCKDNYLNYAKELRAKIKKNNY